MKSCSVPDQSEQPVGTHQRGIRQAAAPAGRRMRQAIGATLGLTSLILLLSTTACQAAEAKSTFDPSSATFAPCPDSPNCVSSQAEPTDEIHYMPAWPYRGSVTDAKAQLLTIVNAQPRTTVVAERDTYLHVEFRSLLFRFVDDVEFYIDERANLIHFRSASRLGHSDMGVNRKRMETIRASFVE